MLSKSDIPITSVIKLLASYGIEAGFLVPTQTGLEKSILDAHGALRKFFKENLIHDYEIQGQGSESKVVLNINLVNESSITTTRMSLYRPPTKLGDPRIWIYGLGEYVKAFNLLVFIVVDRELYLFNASNERILRRIVRFQSTENYGNLFESIEREDKVQIAHIPKIDLLPLESSPLEKLLIRKDESLDSAELELISRLKNIAAMGFVNSLRTGDTGVGMTLETLLGIEANSNRAPDFQGIEIKAKRVKGKNKKSTNRVNLYSQVPNWNKSVCKSGIEILRKYGYIDPDTRRLQLYCTNSNLPNPQGLYLQVNEENGILESLNKSQKGIDKVVFWELDNLKKQLELKHKRTFWVKADSVKIDDSEKFHYIEIEKTQTPLSGNLPALIEIGAITMDYTLSQKPTGNSSRDHGYLFKIHPDNFDLLFPPTKIISLI
jgi:hypothetical protein